MVCQLTEEDMSMSKQKKKRGVVQNETNLISFDFLDFMNVTDRRKFQVMVLCSLTNKTLIIAKYRSMPKMSKI